MKVSDLEIPKFRRKIQGRPEPVHELAKDVEFTGEVLTEFLNDLVVTNPHYTTQDVETIRTANRIVGRAVPDSTLGTPFGAMYGRYWYALEN